MASRHRSPLYQQVAAAMAAHAENLVHRALKPNNIMLRRTGNGLQAKVVDCRITELDAAHFGSGVKRVQSRPEQPLGTPRCMAPGQWRDASTIKDNAEVYSLDFPLRLDSLHAPVHIIKLTPEP